MHHATNHHSCKDAARSPPPPPLPSPPPPHPHALLDFVSGSVFFSGSKHPYYVGTQYHPEFLSRPLEPSPPFLGLLLASSGQMDAWLEGSGNFAPKHDGLVDG